MCRKDLKKRQGFSKMKDNWEESHMRKCWNIRGMIMRVEKAKIRKKRMRGIAGLLAAVLVFCELNTGIVYASQMQEESIVELETEVYGAEENSTVSEAESETVDDRTVPETETENTEENSTEAETERNVEESDTEAGTEETVEETVE